MSHCKDQNCLECCLERVDKEYKKALELVVITKQDLKLLITTICEQRA